MSTTRRDLLRTGLAAAAFGVLHASCGSSASSQSSTTPQAAAPPKPKKILILGGTGFIGPKTVAAALARGHQVTIFNRGKREKIQPLEMLRDPADKSGKMKIEHLYGNRDPELPAEDEKGPDGKLLHPDASPKGLEQLVGKTWDAVIDNSGFFPRHVGASAELLAKQGVPQYIYISSISCYDESAIPAQGGDETTKLATLADPKVETMGAQFENYGGLKALCEQAVQAAFPKGAAIVRPGYIVGPGDPTDRFTYWPMRCAAGGEVLAPGSPDDPLQWIDARDLADWLIHLVEQGTTGAFNAVAPAKPARWGDVLDTCVKAGGGAKLTWVPQVWFDKHVKEEDQNFPIWSPPVGKTAGFLRWSNERAKAAGLTFRTVEDTVQALRAWFPGEIERRVKVTAELAAKAKAEGKEPKLDPHPDALRAGPSREQEKAWLDAFHADPTPA